MGNKLDIPMTLEGLASIFEGTYKINKLQLPTAVKATKNLIPNLDNDMATLIAIHEASTLVSGLNNKIKLDSLTYVPTNVYSLFFAGSGTSKDRSINTIRAAYRDAYDYIKAKQEKLLIAQARKDAEKATGNAKNYQKFLWSIPSMFPTISTEEGAINLMYKLEKLGLGSFNLSVSELGSELKVAKDFTAFMKTMAVGYDKGSIPAKVVKTADLQVNDVNNLNINALMFSSMHTLRADKNTKDKFQDLMTIQFARRVIFYANLDDSKTEFKTTIKDFISKSSKEDDKFNKTADVLGRHMFKLVKKLPTSKHITLSATPDENGLSARSLFKLYEKFCVLKGQNISAKFEMYGLSVTHAFWRALKLSSLFAMLEGRIVIEVEDMVKAISVVEHYTKYLKDFQIELDKEPYELFVDWCKARGIDGKPLKVTRHEITKQKAIAGTLTEQKLNDLAALCNSYDKEGTFIIKNKTLVYTKLAPAKDKKVTEIPDVHASTAKKSTKKNKSVSKKPELTQLTDLSEKSGITVVGSFSSYPKHTAGNKKFKEFTKNKSHKGYEAYSGDLSKYAEALSTNCMFSPYRFKDGVRKMDNIIDPSNVIVLDVDDTHIDIESMHLILSDVTHIIGTTSDPSNQFKYRIVIALDRDINLNSVEWRKFYKSIADELKIEVDTNINKAGYFVGYKDSVVYTNYQGGLLSTQKHIINAKKQGKVEDEGVKVCKTNDDLDIAWDDREELFEFAYLAEKHRGLKLYKAMRDAIRMGFTEQMIKELLLEIANDMPRPFPEKRLKIEVLSQLKKFI